MLKWLDGTASAPDNSDVMLQITSTLKNLAVSRHRIPVAALALLALTIGACSRTAGSTKPDEDTVDNTNTCTTEVELPARWDALEQATALRNAVTWTAAPKIKGSTLTGAGTLAPRVELFDPRTPDGDQRDGPPFSVYYDYGSTKESLAELVPDLSEGQCWKTTATIAPTEVGTPEGGSDRDFVIEASSPLFMDTDVSKLELRVWGTDANGNEALLSVSAIVTD